MEFLPAPLAEMRAYPQFIVYVIKPSDSRPGKTDKFPIDYRTGRLGNAQDPTQWLDADNAIAAAKHFGAGHGVGFVLTANDPYFFLDIDDCLVADGSRWNETALVLLHQFSGAAVEVSSSGRGLHILGHGTVPAGHGCRRDNIEFYTSGRFVALTGTHASGSVETDCTPAIVKLLADYGLQRSVVQVDGWTAEPSDPQHGIDDDEELINTASRSKSAGGVFGGKASFLDLFAKNEDVLRRMYPAPQRAEGYDISSADAALAQHLAYWTGRNCERIKTIMMRSQLLREKWTTRDDYLTRTILNANSRQKDVYVKSGSASIPAQSTPGGTVIQQGYLSIEQQVDLFNGCVYVMDEHKALIPGGYLINSERFRVMYGGYSFVMDPRNERTSRNAWECFTESQSFRSPRVDSATFRPAEPAAAILTEAGLRLVNTFWPIETIKRYGDPKPFLDHIAKLCPDRDDQLILISYMAALIQHQGVKFQWCPLIQGVEGNGKTLLTRCVAFAIGDRYTHFPKAHELTNRFNDWLYGRIFIGVEDIFVADGRQETYEVLKPMITSMRQEIEAKGGVKVTRDICANFMINTNHKDGLRKTRNDRRIAPFYTAQQNSCDLVRDGMNGQYFSRLYRWLANGGYAIVAYYLSTFVIPPQYNPADECDRAPVTSSTETAIAESLGSIEQEIVEQIEQGVPGFRGGWVSSMAVDNLLERIGAGRRIPLRKRRQLLINVGYDVHTGLEGGRVTRVVQPDGGKPRLYARIDSHLFDLKGGAITDEYEKAQK